jgi:hypothetical protein
MRKQLLIVDRYLVFFSGETFVVFGIFFSFSLKHVKTKKLKNQSVQNLRDNLFYFIF